MKSSALVQEDKIPFHGYFTWYRVVGEDQLGKLPLLVPHGRPCFPHDYLETLEALAIWCAQDYCIHASECDVLEKHIRDFRDLQLPAVGHFPMIEAWSSFIEAVTAFLNSLH